MKRIPRTRFTFCVLCAALCGATAWSTGDDTVDVPAGPLPLFSPPDSIRQLPIPEGTAGGARVESKDELYERLRQSLLNLEHHLQEREQEVVVPEPLPEEVVDDGTHAETQHAPPEGQAAEPTSPVPLLDPTIPAVPHGEETIHTDITATESPSTTQSPLTTEIPHPAESTDAFDPHSTIESTPESDPPIAHTPLPIASDAVGNPNIPALADNLFALGEYQLAQSSYEQLDIESLPEEDKIWVTYQLAGCQRHLGETEAAGSLYRQILADYPDHYLAGISRWWLDAMEATSEQTQAIGTIRMALQRINEARDADAAP